MINPRAVKAFLKAHRESHVWLKRKKEKKLDAILDSLKFKSISKKPLRKHQKACIILGIAYPQFAFWLDMGTGKSRIVLELINHFWREGRLHRAIITVTSDESLLGWEEQIEKWKFKVPYVMCGNSATAEKWQSIAELGSGIIFTTYPGFNHLFSKRVPKTKKGKVLKRGRKIKMTMKPDLKKIKAFAKNLDGMVWDESPHIGNHQGLGWKISKKLSAKCFMRFALAGVPFGRDPTLVWAQQYLVDRGESLGETLGIFRAAFFTEKKGYWKKFEYTYRKEMEDDLARLMQHRSISYQSEECGDLPKVTPIPRPVHIAENQEHYVAEALEMLRKARGDKQEIQNVFLRMRQLSSGFIGYKNDETGAKAKIIFPEIPKLEALIEDVKAMPRDCKFVIFHEFTVSGQIIMDRLKEEKIHAGWVWSGTKNYPLLKKRFDNDPPEKFAGLVCNWRKTAESLNLQRANYELYYETPVGVIPRRQSERRCFRTGQTRPGFMIDYLALPVDHSIRAFHQTGANLFKTLITDPFSIMKPRR